MRTTLTIDPDVAVLLEQTQRMRGRSLKSVINEALRRGLREMGAPTQAGEDFRTNPLTIGTCLLPSLDNIADVLAVLEGEDHR